MVPAVESAVVEQFNLVSSTPSMGVADTEYKAGRISKGDFFSCHGKYMWMIRNKVNLS